MRLPGLDTAERLIVGVVDSAVRSRLAKDLIDVVVSGPLIEVVARAMIREQVVDRIAVTAGPEIERIAAEAMDTPAARRIVAQAIDSGVVDEAVARLLESEDLWLLVDEIARSPAVLEAVSSQGIGLADQVAEAVRDRSRSADARLERAARRVLRRKAVVDGG